MEFTISDIGTQKKAWKITPKNQISKVVLDLCLAMSTMSSGQCANSSQQENQSTKADVHADSFKIASSFSAAPQEEFLCETEMTQCLEREVRAICLGPSFEAPIFHWLGWPALSYT